jgi:hypothetical protein
MLVACRLAGLSALEAYYAGGKAGAQCGARPAQWPHLGLITPGTGLMFPDSSQEGDSLAGSRARSTMKGPAPCDGAGNRGCGAGQCLASRAKGVTWLTRANRALVGGYCARDPRLYGCGMGTQLS